jgi:hypothetical protein
MFQQVKNLYAVSKNPEQEKNQQSSPGSENTPELKDTACANGNARASSLPSSTVPTTATVPKPSETIGTSNGFSAFLNSFSNLSFPLRRAAAKADADHGHGATKEAVRLNVYDLVNKP